jgi:hypothetical protein
MGRITKQASSPEEAAKLAGAQADIGFGYRVYDENGKVVLYVPPPKRLGTTNTNNTNTNNSTNSNTGAKMIKSHKTGQMREIKEWEKELKKKISDRMRGATGYAGGGSVNFTGLAMLHGSKERPEYVLNAV